MRRPIVPVLLLVVLTGCSGSHQPAQPTAVFTPPVVTEPPVPSPTPTPTSSPTPGPTGTPTPSATPARRRVPALAGDVDGDGTKDLVRTSADLLTVELSGGGTVTAPVHSDSPRSAPVLGYADVDLDGRSEVFLETAEGASTQFVTPYRYDGKALHELQLDEGPARLGIGGTVTHGDGFRCGHGTLVILSADSPDGSSYTVHVDTYRLGTTSLLLVSSATQHAKQGDPLVNASYQADCGNVGD